MKVMVTGSTGFVGRGAGSFNMSIGDQLRDYMSIDKIAENFVLALESPQVNGVINCCSGQPVSVLSLVQQRCLEIKSEIKLNRGFYPCPSYEPMAFWGGQAFTQIIQDHHEMAPRSIGSIEND